LESGGGGEKVPAAINWWWPVVEEMGDEVDEIMDESRHTEADIWWG
jgi:hypothetical protein